MLVMALALCCHLLGNYLNRGFVHQEMVLLCLYYGSQFSSKLNILTLHTVVVSNGQAVLHLFRKHLLFCQYNGDRNVMLCPFITLLITSPSLLQITLFDFSYKEMDRKQ